MLRSLFLLAGTVLLAVLLWQLGPAEVLRTVGRLGWHSLPILFFFSLYQGLRAVTLKLSILRSRQVSFTDALQVRLSGDALQSLTFFGPFLGEPAKAWLLERRGLTLSEGFAATLTDYLIELMLAAAMSIAGLLYLLRLGTLPSSGAGGAVAVIAVSAAFLLVATFAIWRRFYLIGTVIGWLGRVGLLRGRLRPEVASVNRMEDLLLGILRDRPRRVAAIMLVDVGAQAALILEVAWILHALGLSAPAFQPAIIEASAKFIGMAFFFVPLQVGAAEGSYVVIFGALGLPAAAGFSLAFVRRLRSLLVASAGLAALNVLTGRKAPRGS